MQDKAVLFQGQGYETCADCPEWDACDLIQEWYTKGYYHGKCRQSIEFIRKEGYGEFIRMTNKWENGKLD